jgi:poly(hydroxyalkanoate) depolymerase family esterase
MKVGNAMKKSLIIILLSVTTFLGVLFGVTAFFIDANYERGTFLNQTTATGESYDLVVPASASPFRKSPLIVMLHGGTQTSEELAFLTAMNRHAETHGFLILYPKQSLARNPGGYWNWFLPENQIRFGEPAIIVDQIQTIQATHQIDASAIFAAGFSAGACMAMNLAIAYPEVIAGVGLVGGLGYGVASSAMAALSAMAGTLPDLDATSQSAYLNRLPGNRRILRAIVFHGTADSRVDAENHDYLLHQIAQINDWIDDGTRNHSFADEPDETLPLLDEDHITSTYTKSVDSSGKPYWVGYLIDGMAHRWPGGQDSPFAHPLGPDASALMVDFFFGM